MTRIRKRPSSATSSVKPELHRTNNGCPPSAPQFNPSFQDPRQSLLCPTSAVKDTWLLLPAAANSSHCGFSAQEPKKQPTATPAVHHSKPYIIAASGDTQRGRDEFLDSTSHMAVGEAKLRDHTEAPQHGAAKHIHMHSHGDETRIGLDCKVANEPGLAENGAAYAGRGERAEAACYGRAIEHGSAQLSGELRQVDPTDTDDCVSEQPRKMLPLHFILNSEPRTTLAVKARSIPNELLCTDMMMPCSSSKSISPRVNLKPQEGRCDGAGTEQKGQPLRKPQPLSLEADSEGVVQTPDMKIQAGSKSRREERGNSDQSLDWPVRSSWQGHRRARSCLPSGRLANEVPGLLSSSPGVNIDAHSTRIIKAETKVKVYPLEKKACAQTKKKPLQAKKVVTNSPQKNVIATTEKIVTAGDALKKRKREAASENDELPPRESSDHDIHADSMRCRRKDGRRWRCKEQVVKPGAPFCHYHTLKMREKHATSAARRRAKRLLQSERNGELVGRVRLTVGSKKRQKLAGSSVLQRGYGGGMQMPAREEEEEEEEEEEDDDDDDNDDDDGNGDELKEELESSDSESDQQGAEKQPQQQQQPQSSKSRWRKKCKPCIRRLLDIQDRARPAVADGLDYAASSSVWVVHPPSPVYVSSLRPPASPLPECRLNTDPNEWRSDFP